jgi:hypothetical protein
MASGIRDGARLIRMSFQLVRHDRTLLLFPVASSVCFVVTTLFWVFEGIWLSTLRGTGFLYVPLILAALYSLAFIGIFFNVALAGAADVALRGSDASFSDGMEVAWARLGPIARWAFYSLCVSIALSFVERINKWLGRAATVAWNLATFFVVPLIAFEGVTGGAARRRSFELARLNWQAEGSGLGLLHAVMFVPGGVGYLAFKELENGHMHSSAGKALVAVVLVVVTALAFVAGVVRQVFAVSLYRTSVVTE